MVDRVIQQAITQELSPIYEEQFSENSFGFRPNRGAHDALRQCQKNVNDGYVYVVDMDLEKFFDTVCQSKLIEVLSRTIKDGRVISLIHKYLNAGVIANGLFERTEVGMPQGGPLSPLLSNIMLNELDKELEHRGHRFVRYADDCMIFCRSRKSAERALANILPFIEGKLFLKVNRKKTQTTHISKVKYLGYTFYRYKGKCRFRVHPKSVQKMKNKLRELTDRNNGMSNQLREEKYQQFVRGWVNYFKLADMKELLKGTDEWARRRIRAVYWKQWKKTKTKYRMLKALRCEHWRASDNELDGLFERIYEDNLAGKLSDERFAKMSQRYEAEQAELAEKMKLLRHEIDKLSSNSVSTDLFLSTVRKYTRAKKLTPRMLNELINRIEVHQAEKINGEWVQRLTIHYNCIGALFIPDTEPLPVPNVTVNTRRGVYVTYEPAQNE